MAGKDSSKRGNGFKDETGNVYGKLTVLFEVHSDKPGAYWRCRCECGHEFDIFGGNLRASQTRRKQACIKCRPADNATHGLTDTPEHCIWKAIRQRCFSPSSQDHGHYGGRGITVCDRWNSFSNFLADMGPKPFPKASVGRIDNDGNYSCGKCPECVTNRWPSNCRWETQKQQTRNTSRNHVITFRGRTQCLAAWAEESCLTMSALKHRIARGWDIEKALTTPMRGRKP